MPTGITPSGGVGFEEVDADDCVTMVQLAIQKCLEKEALCNEFYLQLIKQTTDQPGILSLPHGVVIGKHSAPLLYILLSSWTPSSLPDPNGRINIQNWRLLSLIVGVVVPRNRVILNYLQAHLRRCSIDTNTEEGSFAQFCMQVSRKVNHTS